RAGRRTWGTRSTDSSYRPLSQRIAELPVGALALVHHAIRLRDRHVDRDALGIYVHAHGRGEEFRVRTSSGLGRLLDLVDPGRKHVEAAAGQVLVHAGQDHEELVASPADHVVVAADELLDRGRDGPDGAVALLVALLVVDPLEAVQIDQDDRSAELARLEC